MNSFQSRFLVFSLVTTACTGVCTHFLCGRVHAGDVVEKAEADQERPRSIMIEAKFVEIDEKVMEELGFDWITDFEGPTEPAEIQDKLAGKVVVDPGLKSDFFTRSQKSRDWHIVEHADGSLEDTLDGSVDKEDRLLIEHTSNCVSSHQGRHVMSFCTAKVGGGGTTIRLSGGLPAYASSLTVKIDGDQNVRCSFEAPSPGPAASPIWRITKKRIHLMKRESPVGSRMFGWLCVEFEEGVLVEGERAWTSHKIEGHIKPVVEKMAKSDGSDGQGLHDSPRSTP